MDETTKKIIDKISVVYPKPTQIPTGQLCSVFYDCFQLSPSDLARLAADAVGDVDHDTFDIVVGLAYSGILFAAAVAGGKKVAILQKDGQLFGPALAGLRVIVADDVVHSGRRMREAAAKVIAAGGEVIGFACIVDRSGGRFSAGMASENMAKLGPLWSAFQTDME
ncbi:MAG: Phosphoribosyl transferase domain [Pseudomonadota bacterium]|jgi:orotate phosphoribosyltransferase